MKSIIKKYKQIIMQYVMSVVVYKGVSTAHFDITFSTTKKYK